MAAFFLQHYLFILKTAFPYDRINYTRYCIAKYPMFRQFMLHFADD